MSIMWAVLSLCGWFMDLPGGNGDEASGDPHWETTSEYKSWKVWAAPFCWTCYGGSALEAGTGAQEGLTSYLGVSVCAELLNSCGAWRGRSSRHVSPHPAFWEGEVRVAGKLPSLALLLPAKCSGKKSFQILAKSFSTLTMDTRIQN